MISIIWQGQRKEKAEIIGQLHALDENLDWETIAGGQYVPVALEEFLPGSFASQVRLGIVTGRGVAGRGFR